MILLLYLQQNLDVSLDSSSLRGQFASKKECETAAVRLRGPLPTPGGYSAAWHDVLCVPIARDVAVNDGKPVDLGKLLEGRPPTVCEASGAWRRVVQLCAAPTSAPPEGPDDPTQASTAPGK
jgi:hypothetical protein